jgi:hypothetical protein
MAAANEHSWPELRATVTRRGELVMTPWSPGAARPGGPAASQLRPRRVVGVFDLTIERDHADGITIAADLIVSDVFATDRVELGHRRLVEFAVDLGYRRAWFGHEVVAIEPELLGGTWRSTCRHCGVTWSDASDQFWLHIRGCGHYPMFCALCSHPIAQPVGERERTTGSPLAATEHGLETVPVQRDGHAVD